MIELLRRVRDLDPTRPAILTHDQVLTYAEVLDLADRASRSLRSRGITRIAVVDHDATVAVPVMAAAAATGVEVCLYPPVSAEEVGDLLERFDHQVVVTSRDDVAAAGGRRVFTPADLLSDAGGRDVQAWVGPRPHLVLTTGTTGAPRGVRHDWSRLVRSVARVRPSGDDERWLLAYGLHQFAGLQILLHAAAAGATLVAPAPRRPREGLAAMRELGVTHASATPTYWRFLLAELRADGGPVPHLRQVTLGGEASSAALLADLAETFPDAHVSHIYAASEFGSTGSTRDGLPGLPAEVLARGDDSDVAMRIVDGELWIRSSVGMLGYHGEPDVDDGWRASGDLVEVRDGRVLFLGRRSEIINVGGVKVHPLPIEELVATVPGVEIARVFGRTNPLTGQIVAIEVVAAEGHDPETVKLAVREACQTLPGPSRPRSVRTVDTVATTGSKIVRRT